MVPFPVYPLQWSFLLSIPSRVVFTPVFSYPGTSSSAVYYLLRALVAFLDNRRTFREDKTGSRRDNYEKRPLKTIRHFSLLVHLSHGVFSCLVLSCPFFCRVFPMAIFFFCLRRSPMSRPLLGLSFPVEYTAKKIRFM